MTKLERPVTRVVSTSRGELVVRMTADGIEIRERNRRKTYPLLSWTRLHVQAAELAAAEHRKPRGRSRTRLAVGV